MAHPAFDTLKFVETLTEAGIAENQAKAIAKAQNMALSEALDNSIVTKENLLEVQQGLNTKIHEVHHDLKMDIQGLKVEIQEVRQELKAEIQEVRQELKSDIAEIKSEQKLMKWILGFLMAGVTSIFAGVASLMVKIFF